MRNSVGVGGKAIIIFLSLFFISASAEKENIFEYSGKAVSRAGKLIYKELQKEHYQNGKIALKFTEYRDQNNNVIARRSLDFKKSIYFPDMVLEDLRSGKRSAVLCDNERVKIIFRKDRNAPEKQKEIRLPDNFITDDGIHYFILKHWKYLSEGKKVFFHFPVPRMLDVFKFQLTQEPTSVPNKFIVRMDPSDFILKSICKPIYLEYDRGTRRMIRYNGISNLPMEGEKILDVIIYYNYPEYMATSN